MTFFKLEPSKITPKVITFNKLAFIKLASVKFAAFDLGPLSLALNRKEPSKLSLSNTEIFSTASEKLVYDKSAPVKSALEKFAFKI